MNPLSADLRLEFCFAKFQTCIMAKEARGRQHRAVTSPFFFIYFAYSGQKDLTQISAMIIFISIYIYL
jgi:hypothetical protein